MGFDILWVGSPIYHAQGVQYIQCTLGRGSKYHGYVVQYTMDKGFDISCVEGSKYHRLGVRYTIGRRQNAMCRGWVHILRLEGSIYHM